MAVEQFAYVPHPALVSRPGAPTSYLLLNAAGKADWTPDPKVATTFESMREAARAALRLPASVKAYGLPLEAEMALSRAH